MMQTRKWLLFCAVVVAGLTVFAAPAVTAAEPLSPAALPQPPPRECTINVPGGNVHIQAGPNEASGPAPDFPLLRSGAVCAGLERCLEWRYLFTYTDLTPEKAALAVDTDITVQDCEPDCRVTTHIPLVSQGERTVVFAATTNPFPASYFTPVGVTPGTMTASFVAKKGFFPRVGLCAIAGADNLIPEQNQPVDQVVVSELRSETGAILCTVERTVDIKNRTVAVKVVSGTPPCVPIGLKQLAVQFAGAQRLARFIDGETQLTVDGSHIFCWASTTTGKMTCVQTPSH